MLRALVAAHRHLAELKGVARSIPNERLLVSTLSLQEAQSSSEIENIITTQDALYRYQVQPGSVDPASKEVAWYAQSLEVGFQAVRASGLLRLSTILEVQATALGTKGLKQSVHKHLGQSGGTTASGEDGAATINNLANHVIKNRDPGSSI